jgi:hypothetical protein
MKSIFWIAAGTVAFALAGAAQDGVVLQTTEQMKGTVEKLMAGAQVMKLEGAVMGPAVKGAPYTADEIRETTQVLADGTRIHNQSKTTVYRDSAGRVRRETPDTVTIWDSEAHTNYVLDENNKTARKMAMGMSTFSYSTSTGAGGTMGGMIGSVPKSDSVKTDAQKKEFRVLITSDGVDGLPPLPRSPVAIAADKAIADKLVVLANHAAKESLGNRIIEGLTAEGAKTTTTLETGAIGNDRPIQTVVERWYSPDLQVNLLTTRTDPRTGEESVRLENVRRGEPDPALFRVPARFEVLDRK